MTWKLEKIIASATKPSTAQMMSERSGRPGRPPPPPPKRARPLRRNSSNDVTLPCGPRLERRRRGPGRLGLRGAVSGRRHQPGADPGAHRLRGPPPPLLPDAERPTGRVARPSEAEGRRMTRNTGVGDRWLMASGSRGAGAGSQKGSFKVLVPGRRRSPTLCSLAFEPLLSNSR